MSFVKSGEFFPVFFVLFLKAPRGWLPRALGVEESGDLLLGDVVALSNLVVGYIFEEAGIGFDGVVG